MCSAFVSPDGLKNDEYHICSASFRVMALKTTNVTCVARLFRLMTERYFLSLANWPPGGPIDSFQNELSPSHPIKSVSQDLQPPSLLLTSYSRYHWSSASRLFPVPVKIGLNPPPGEDNLTQAGCIGHLWQLASRINEMKYPTTKRNSPLQNDFKIFQQMEPVERISMKLLVVYLHCTWTVTLSLVVWKFLLVKTISYPPLSFLCNAKIVISARVILMFSWMRPW